MDRLKQAFIVIGVMTMVAFGVNVLSETATGQGFLSSSPSR
jgi:hypothetical protein